MKLVSINLNQRLGNPVARSRFQSWLDRQQPELLLSQEPFRPSNAERPLLVEYNIVQTGPLLTAWIRSDIHSPNVLVHNDRWHEFRLGHLSVHNVYLADNSSKARREQLVEMTDHFENGSDRVTNCVAHLVVGDFNLAPEPEDGLFDGQPSRFTSVRERSALRAFMDVAQLLDTTRPAMRKDCEFSFARKINGKQSSFRCDLALISMSLAASTEVTYDHSVRSSEGFTDHSAIVIHIKGCEHLAEVAPSLLQNERSQVLLRQTGAVGMRSAQRLDPDRASYKTAIKRTSPSQIARALCDSELLCGRHNSTVLDYGCGFGSDVELYRSLGFQADGYDREPRFGWNCPVSSHYDLVTLVFVLNVLSSIEARLQAVRSAAEFVAENGHLFVAARSEAAIRKEAVKGNWERFSDGWISSKRRGTFQKGISTAEIGWYLGAVGLPIRPTEISLSSDVCWLVGRRG